MTTVCFFTSMPNILIFQTWKLKRRTYCMWYQFLVACRYSSSFLILCPSLTQQISNLKAVFGFKHQISRGRNYKLYLSHCFICSFGVWLSLNILEWDSHLLVQLADRAEAKYSHTLLQSLNYSLWSKSETT